MTELRVCEGCARRVNVTEVRCPFCATELPPAARAVSIAHRLRTGISRAEFLALAAAVSSQALTGCVDSHSNGGMDGGGGMNAGSGGSGSGSGSGGVGYGGVYGNAGGIGGYAGFYGNHGGTGAYGGTTGGDVDAGDMDASADDDASTKDAGPKDGGDK